MSDTLDLDLLPWSNILGVRRGGASVARSAALVCCVQVWPPEQMVRPVSATMTRRFIPLPVDCYCPDR